MRSRGQLNELVHTQRSGNLTSDPAELSAERGTMCALGAVERALSNGPISLKIMRRAVEVERHAIDAHHRFRIGAHFAPPGILVPPCGCVYCGGILGAAEPKLI